MSPSEPVPHRCKWKTLMQNVFLLGAAIVIAFVIAEVGFRLVGLGDTRNDTFTDFIKHSAYNPFLIIGPIVNFDVPQGNGEYAHWNTQGLRMQDELPLKKPNSEFRIFALGGSTTENLSNNMNVHYPQEAMEILNTAGITNKTINIINAGTSSYSTAHSLVRFQFDLLQFQPDMITVMHNINDLTVNYFPADARTNYANKYLVEGLVNPFDIRDIFFRHSRIAIVVYKAFLSLKMRMGSFKEAMHYAPQPIDLTFKESFQDNLIALSRIAKAHGITPVFLSQPALFTDEKITQTFGYKSYNDRVLYPTRDEFQQHFEEYNQVIKDVATGEHIYFIDMYNLMGHEEEDFVDAVHLTAKGVKKFAAIYSEELSKLIK